MGRRIRCPSGSKTSCWNANDEKEPPMSVKSVLEPPPPPPPPTQTILNFEKNGWKWVLFWVKLCWGGVRERSDEPKANEKNLQFTITWGCFFPAVQSSFDLHCWIGRKILAFFFLAPLRQLLASHQGFFVPRDHLVTKSPLLHIGLKCVSVLSFDSFASMGVFLLNSLVSWPPFSNFNKRWVLERTIVKLICFINQLAWINLFPFTITNSLLC